MNPDLLLQDGVWKMKYFFIVVFCLRTEFVDNNDKQYKLSAASSSNRRMSAAAFTLRLVAPLFTSPLFFPPLLPLSLSRSE